MSRPTRWSAVASVLVCLGTGGMLAAPAAAQGRDGPEITLSGSDTMRPLVADLAFYYRRERRRPPRFVLRGGGSEIGADDAQRRIVTVGMVSRDRRPDDDPSLVFTRIATSGICLVTNRANPVPGLTRAQVQDLLAERTTAWEQVPGAVQRGPLAPAGFALGTSPRRTFLEVFADDATPVTYRPRGFATERILSAYVRATPAAWGYIDFAFLRGLHAVPYEGVPCTRASIAAGTYPARRGLYLVTRGRPRPAAARFIGWIRSDRTARRVIETRYVAAGR